MICPLYSGWGNNKTSLSPSCSKLHIPTATHPLLIRYPNIMHTKHCCDSKPTRVRTNPTTKNESDMHYFLWWSQCVRLFEFIFQDHFGIGKSYREYMQKHEEHKTSTILTRTTNDKTTLILRPAQLSPAVYFACKMMNLCRCVLHNMIEFYAKSSLLMVSRVECMKRVNGEQSNREKTIDCFGLVLLRQPD